MKNKLVELLQDLLSTRCSEDECANLADYIIASGIVGDKEMIRHLFNRCAAITQCGLCFCCGYQKECESTRNVFAKEGEA